MKPYNISIEIKPDENNPEQCDANITIDPPLLHPVNNKEKYEALSPAEQTANNTALQVMNAIIQDNKVEDAEYED